MFSLNAFIHEVCSKIQYIPNAKQKRMQCKHITNSPSDVSSKCKHLLARQCAQFSGMLQMHYWW